MTIDVKTAPAVGPVATLASEPPAITNVGVIGAGQMGNGIAHVCALAGLPVTLLDINDQVLEQALGTIGRNLDRQINRKVIAS